jgi:hypothetical protein
MLGTTHGEGGASLLVSVLGYVIEFAPHVIEPSTVKSQVRVLAHENSYKVDAFHVYNSSLHPLSSLSHLC